MVFKPQPRGLLSLKPLFRRAGVRAADCERDSSGPARKRLWPQINTEFDSHRTSDGPSPPAHPEHLRFPSACCVLRLPERSAGHLRAVSASRRQLGSKVSTFSSLGIRSSFQIRSRVPSLRPAARRASAGGRGAPSRPRAGGGRRGAGARGDRTGRGLRLEGGAAGLRALPLGIASDRSPERFRSGFLTGSAGRSSHAVAPRHGNVRSGRVIRPRQMCSNRQGVVFLCLFFIFLFYSFILFPPTNSAVRALVSSISSKRTSRKIFAFTVLLTGGSWASPRHRPLA